MARAFFRVGHLLARVLEPLHRGEDEPPRDLRAELRILVGVKKERVPSHVYYL